MAEALNIQDTSWSGPAASYMITRAVVVMLKMELEKRRQYQELK